MDIATVREMLWHQFGASIDMLRDSIAACPDELFVDRQRKPECSYLAYHTLFWLDFYLHGSVEGFAPPEPFNLDEFDPAGVFPERPYTKKELLTYLDHCRGKCKAAMESLTEEKASRRCTFGWGAISYFELCLYNMRHVQHGAAQLNVVLRQRTDSAPHWVLWAR